MVDVKARDVEGRLEEYYNYLASVKVALEQKLLALSDIDEAQGMLSGQSYVPQAVEVLDYLDQEGLSDLLQDDFGFDVISTSKRIDAHPVPPDRLSKDKQAFMSIGTILGIVSFIVLVIDKIRAFAKKYQYIARWKPTQSVENYSYAVEGALLYKNLSEFIQKKFETRKVAASERKHDFGFLFGGVGKNKKISVRAIVPFESFGIEYTEKTAQDFLVQLVEEADAVDLRVFAKYFKGQGKDLCSGSFKSMLKRSSSRGALLERNFVGMYFFEEDLLRHDLITADMLQNAMRRANLKKGQLGISKFPKFLFMEKKKYINMVSFCEEFRAHLESLGFFKKRPFIVLCLDNKKTDNCMCLSHHPDFGYQRVRYLKKPTKILLKRLASPAEAIELYPEVFKRHVEATKS